MVEIIQDRKGATRFRVHSSFWAFQVKGSVISALITMVAGAHMGAVSRSASPPPMAAATKA